MSKLKVIAASCFIVAALVFGTFSFVQTNVEYTDFQTAVSSHRRVQVKGEWARDMESRYDSQKNKFIFCMKDDNDQVLKVVLDGPKPNNFDIANAVVVKGRYENGVFQATDCLTKCPSKYEGTAPDLKQRS